MTHSIAGSEPTFGTRSVTRRSLHVLSVGVPLAPKLPHPVKLLLKGTEQDGIGGHDEVLFVVLRSASGPVVAAGKQSPIAPPIVAQQPNTIGGAIGDYRLPPTRNLKML